MRPWRSSKKRAHTRIRNNNAISETSVGGGTIFHREIKWIRYLRVTFAKNLCPFLVVMVPFRTTICTESSLATWEKILILFILREYQFILFSLSLIINKAVNAILIFHFISLEIQCQYLVSEINGQIFFIVYIEFLKFEISLGL